MKPIIIELNENGNVELAKERLQEMLNEAYAEGRKDSFQYVPFFPNNNPEEPTAEAWNRRG